MWGVNLLEGKWLDGFQDGKQKGRNEGVIRSCLTDIQIIGSRLSMIIHLMHTTHGTRM